MRFLTICFVFTLLVICFAEEFEAVPDDAEFPPDAPLTRAKRQYGWGGYGGYGGWGGRYGGYGGWGGRYGGYGGWGGRRWGGW
ncbi:unnamed protein product [Strongylus vulgaris]|uniref:Neuropeptide-like protein 31 n=1 Tax=Strongylus vulgaris TaxID=40348 RepID=A0A3P7L6W0_STRVU|nr:unnamed protein product [Strongylus vulgaris]